MKFREEELLKKQEERQKKKDEQTAAAEEKERILEAIRAKVHALFNNSTLCYSFCSFSNLT